MDIIKETFEEMKIGGFRPLRDLLLIRADPVPVKTGRFGLIYKPPKAQSFFGLLPHIQPVTGIVLAAGPKATVTPGERVAFMRLNFAWWMQLEPTPIMTVEGCLGGVVIGWVQEANVFGFADLDEGQISADLRVDNPSRTAMQ